jgi:hypothetical protein
MLIKSNWVQAIGYKWEDGHIFTFRKWHKLILVVWTGCSIRYAPWNFSCSSYSGMSLEIWDLTVSASNYSLAGRPETQTKLIIYQDAVKSAVEYLRARIAHQGYIIEKFKFLVNSQILNWINRSVSGRSFHLEVWIRRSSLFRTAHSLKSSLPNSEICGRKTASRRHRHHWYIVKKYVTRNSSDTRLNIELISDHLSKWGN